MFEKEMAAGQNAVIEAMRISKTVQQELTGADAITKTDKSPVTIADFASQAIICKLLKTQFPSIPIVAEENSDALSKPENCAVLEKILYFITRDEKIKNILDKNNLCRNIDLGTDEPSKDVFWTLDPIDGTKGFLRGEQFAIALALIVNGEVQLGILGCPNLKLWNDGCLLFAEKGSGAFAMDIQNFERKKVEVSGIIAPHKMRFVESYVSSHSDMDTQGKIARELELEEEPVRMDSQVKYGVLAAGQAEIYLRIPHPKTPDYREKIWDHAAGSLIVTEAGGMVSDIIGNKLDFSGGKTLAHNRGIFASVPAVHSRILDIIKELH
ncbi:MAG: 3'(2'),5'-bisphosphate nucleotidase [Acidobacteria bacterium]|jgi:3'(2'), 5'-bisphosphate nucleotidase|nr:3'(2'),5'-bisphosphate nucleotidase [Acidobacteriota bacterium]